MKKHVFKHVMMGLAAIAGFSAVTMLLWNWLMPGMFGLGAISFWQALGLLVLIRILFGGIGGGHWMHRHSHRNPVREKWQKMTPEERDEFVKSRHFGHHFGHFGCCSHDRFHQAEVEKKD